MLAGGDLALLLEDSEDARAVMEFIATDTFGAPWAQAGGWLSPHVGFDTSNYSTEVERSLAEIGTSADVLRFDASDLMPGAVGAGSFWTGIGGLRRRPEQPRRGAGRHRRELAGLGRQGSEGAPWARSSTPPALVIAGVGGTILLFWLMNKLVEALPEHWEERLKPYAFIGPALIFVGVFLVFPAVNTIYISFFDDRSEDFVGFENYGDVLTDPATLVGAVQQPAVAPDRPDRVGVAGPG